MAKRIFMLGPDPKKAFGGMAAVVESYMNSDFFHKHQICYIATNNEIAIRSDKKITCNKLKVAMVAWVVIIKALLKGKVSALHVHCATDNSFWRKSVFIITGYFFRIPILVHIHGSDPAFYGKDCGAFKRTLIVRVLNLADRLIVLSAYWEELFKDWGVKATIKILPNPVELIPVLENKSKQIQLLFMGVLLRRKGVFQLLEAFKQLIKKYPNLHLVYAGSGELFEDLKDKINLLGLGNQITLAGWVQGADKMLLLQQSTIFILPSYNECFPVSLLEAMSAGIPSVVTNVGGVVDIIQDGDNGLLVNPGDIEEIVLKVSALLDDKLLRERIGKNGRDYVISHFECNLVMSLLESIYRELKLIN